MARFGSVAVINKVGLIIMKPFYCIDVGSGNKNFFPVFLSSFQMM
jgi:hypothetical protein